MRVNSNLIFDLGLHKGFDAEIYLAKGFEVVGLEAVPALCIAARERNQAAFAAGRLKIVQRALYKTSNKKVTFFVNTQHDDWGSLDQASAEKDVSESQPIEVDTISLQDLISEFGLPYYLKCDLEGGDAILAAELLNIDQLPPFVSIEATAADDLGMLRAAGYTKFQIVNQWMNPFAKAPRPAREGDYVDIEFTAHTSGLFGRELPPTKWVDFTVMIKNFLKWYDLHEFDSDVGVGWLDVHATTEHT